MIKDMDVNELNEKIKNGEELLLIDCREQEEWDSGHINAARFLPLSDWENVSKELDKNKDAQIIIQCRSGKRSFNACMNLMDRGYSNLTNLTGGILAWQEKGFDVES